VIVLSLIQSALTLGGILLPGKLVTQVPLKSFGSNAFKRRTEPERGFRFRVQRLLEPNGKFAFSVQRERP
jgi:hypothetical protein